MPDPDLESKKLKNLFDKLKIAEIAALNLSNGHYFFSQIKEISVQVSKKYDEIKSQEIPDKWFNL